MRWKFWKKKKRLKRLKRRCSACLGTGSEISWGEKIECSMCNGYGWYYYCPDGDGRYGLYFSELPTKRVKKKFEEKV